jgi:hypothetical protein
VAAEPAATLIARPVQEAVPCWSAASHRAIGLEHAELGIARRAHVEADSREGDPGDQRRVFGRSRAMEDPVSLQAVHCRRDALRAEQLAGVGVDKSPADLATSKAPEKGAGGNTASSPSSPKLTTPSPASPAESRAVDKAACGPA